jgi:hypothetical protein
MHAAYRLRHRATISVHSLCFKDCNIDELEPDEARGLYVIDNFFDRPLDERRTEFEIRLAQALAARKAKDAKSVMAKRSIDDRERYVGYATHCLQLAKATADRESRAIGPGCRTHGQHFPDLLI